MNPPFRRLFILKFQNDPLPHFKYRVSKPCIETSSFMIHENASRLSGVFSGADRSFGRRRSSRSRHHKLQLRPTEPHPSPLERVQVHPHRQHPLCRHRQPAVVEFQGRVQPPPHRACGSDRYRYRYPTPCRGTLDAETVFASSKGWKVSQLGQEEGRWGLGGQNDEMLRLTF